MRRTISTVTVAGGLASIVFVPLTQYLVETFDWRVAITVLGCTAGTLTAALHSRYLPRNNAAHHDPAPSPQHEGSSPSMATRPMRRLHIAYVLEQGSAVAATALIVTMLIDRGVDPSVAALVLAVTGGGKVGGRLLLAGRIGRTPPRLLAGGAAAMQAIAVISTLATLSTAWLFAAALATGIAAGTSSVLRPLMIANYVPLYAFPSASARMQTSTTVARAAGPVIIAGAAPHIGWTGAWALVASGLTAAAGTFSTLGKRRRIVGYGSPESRADVL